MIPPVHSPRALPDVIPISQRSTGKKCDQCGKIIVRIQENGRRIKYCDCRRCPLCNARICDDCGLCRGNCDARVHCRIERCEECREILLHNGEETDGCIHSIRQVEHPALTAAERNGTW